VERFFKYHGLGNDFVVLDRRASGTDLDADAVVRLCDRHFGIGADGLLTVLPHVGAAGRMVVHNADGSIAEMCGNGLRCVAKYLAEHSGAHDASMLVATGAGLLRCDLDWSGSEVSRVTVSMGPARLHDASLPTATDGGPFLQRLIEGHFGTAVSMGNPHLVLLDTAPSQAATLGPRLERHPLFPDRTNVEFVTARPGGGLEVTVWERGVGLTLACGTGACAATVAAGLAGRAAFDAWVPVALPGGLLEIEVAAGLASVRLRGPAAFVYEGVLS
jgi:diaminopimelate epimerase